LRSSGGVGTAIPKPSASFFSPRVPSHGGGTDPGFGAAGEDDGTSLGDGSADADREAFAVGLAVGPAVEA